MRVLMLSWEYPPHTVGGLAKHVVELLPALAAAGVDLHLITPNLRDAPPEEQIAPNARVYRVSLPDMSIDGPDLVTFVQTANGYLQQKARDLLISTGPFDLVHAHDWLVAYCGVAAKYAGRIPLVATIHSTERGRGQGYLVTEQALAINGTEWWLGYEATRVITVSQFMAGQLAHDFSMPDDKIDVIPNGVSLSATRWLTGAERLAFRRQFAHDDEPIVFYVGRVVYEKGVHVLVDAAPQIIAQIGTTKFVIAGTGMQLDSLRHRAWERGVYDQFYFTGFVSDADRDRLFQVADVAVFPSLYEPFGIVAIEAMSYRCPVVVAAAGGLSEVVRNHETGMTSYPGNPSSLAWAVCHTLEHPDWAQARAENGWREVQQIYNWNRIAKETIAVYRRAQELGPVLQRSQPDYEQAV